MGCFTLAQLEIHACHTPLWGNLVIRLFLFIPQNVEPHPHMLAFWC